MTEKLRGITDGELTEIEARASAASPGPWMVNGKAAGGWRIDDGNPDRVGMAFLLTPTALVMKKEDADFIAESRDDIPRLVAEIRRLRKA